VSNLTHDQASRIIKGVLSSARGRDLAPIAVIVLDGGRHPIAFVREDGASSGRFDIAKGKANGALALGVGSRSIMRRAEEQAYFVASATAALEGGLVPVPGGVLVKDDAGRVLGAVGVSGDASDNDEAAAIDGIQRAGLTAEAG